MFFALVFSRQIAFCERIWWCSRLIFGASNKLFFSFQILVFLWQCSLVVTYFGMKNVSNCKISGLLNFKLRQTKPDFEASGESVKKTYNRIAVFEDCVLIIRAHKPNTHTYHLPFDSCHTYFSSSATLRVSYILHLSHWLDEKNVNFDWNFQTLNSVCFLNLIWYVRCIITRALKGASN